MQQLPLRVRPIDAARFETFVPGPNARVLQLLAGESTPKVLWLWGRPGCGKSHLLRAACADVGEHGGAATYVELRDSTPPALLEGCESLDLVALDDLDRVSGQAGWNAAIFRLHTLMQDAPGRLLVASGPPPAALTFQLADLGSRLLAAPAHGLRELDEAGQVQVLGERAARRGLELGPEAATWLVHHVRRDLHSLCAVLDQLDEAALAAQRRLTVPFLRQVLESQAPGGS